MKRSRRPQSRASANEVCPDTSINAVQQSRRHSSFWISPSVQLGFHIGVACQSGTCVCASGHWRPSESSSQRQLEPRTAVLAINGCCCKYCCVGVDIGIGLGWHCGTEKDCSALDSTTGTAFRTNVEAVGLSASRYVIASKRRIESRLFSDEYIRVI